MRQRLSVFATRAASFLVYFKTFICKQLLKKEAYFQFAKRNILQQKCNLCIIAKA